MKKFLLLFIFLLAGLIAALAVVYQQYEDFLQQEFSLKNQGENSALIIKIPRGSSYADMVDQLMRLGVTDKRWPWRLLQRLQPQLIKAGEYQLEAGLRPQQWLQKLNRGRVVRYSFTIIEGWRAADLLTALQKDPRLQHQLDVDNQAVLAAKLGIPTESIEGWFLPETYSFVRGDSDLDILTQAYQSMQKQLDTDWQSRKPDLPLHSAYEMLILASIVEKETSQPDERAEIAGVFVRRLNKHMRLQTDPTVIYGLGDAYDGDIRSRDLRTDTPYNTYTRFGLPPTPIALPGAASIEAVSQPTDAESLYFVADGTGGHTFSKTYQEHNLAVKKMLQRN